MVITGNYPDFYNKTMLPALRGIAGEAFRKRPLQFSRVFQVLASSKSIEQYSQLTGVGRFQYIAEGAAVKRDMPMQGFNATFTHSRYGLAIPTSKDMVEDDKWNIVGRYHQKLGWSASETRELQAAAIFNNGFTGGAYAGPDGKALFATDHPLVKAGGTQSNVGTGADLDMSSLQLALTAIETMKSSSGEFTRWGKPKLLHAPANRFLAHALLKSKDDPTTADRSTNPLDGAEDGMPQPMTWLYLTDPDAWFLVAEPSETGLIWFNRKDIYSQSWTDDETEVGVFAMRYRASVGFNDYTGVWGNAGA